MSDITLPAKAWVIVCDGAKVLYLQNTGTAVHPALTVVDADTQADAPDRALGTDRPGRVYQSEGTARSSMEQTDFHAQAEADFLKDVAARITALVADGRAEHVVLVAPPKALGLLRLEFSAAATAAIKVEIAKDLAHRTVAEIEKHLFGDDG